MSHPPSEKISIAEFARRAFPGRNNRKAVQRAIEKGLLLKDSDDLLNASDVTGDWRRPNRRTIGDQGATNHVVAPATTDVVAPRRPAQGTASAKPSETPTQAAERIVKEAGVLSLSEAIAMKETYQAYLRRLEYDQKVGLVVPIADVAEAYGAQLSTVRRRLLALPSEAAPALLRCRTAPELQAALYDAVHRALTALTAPQLGDDATEEETDA